MQGEESERAEKNLGGLSSTNLKRPKKTNQTVTDVDSIKKRIFRGLLFRRLLKNLTSLSLLYVTLQCQSVPVGPSSPRGLGSTSQNVELVMAAVDRPFPFMLVVRIAEVQSSCVGIFCRLFRFSCFNVLYVSQEHTRPHRRSNRNTQNYVGGSWRDDF